MNIDGKYKTYTEEMDETALRAPLRATGLVAWRQADVFAEWLETLGEGYGVCQSDLLQEAARETLGAILRHELDGVLEAFIEEGRHDDR